MLNLLEIIQEAVIGTGITAPSSIVAGNKQGQQLHKIANSAAKKIATAHKWNELRVEATFTAIAASLQFSMATQYPAFREMLAQTFWNRTKKFRVKGPLSPEEWQEIQAVSFSPSRDFYRIAGGNLYLLGSYSAGDSMAFEYLTSKIITNVAGTETFTTFTSDTDIPLLDDQALILCIRWMYRYEKGLEYTEHFRDYEDRLAWARGANSEPDVLSMTPFRNVSKQNFNVGTHTIVSEAPTDWSMDSDDFSG